ncbi:MAG TPA: fused MFS/spermidine synthase [Myxococcota bacterium]|nr:fused MFS/spermidine synthase [Myxococcota bacterium]
MFAALYITGALSALLLEVSWTRLMATLLGSAVIAVSAVLAAFMGGLAAGAYLGGRLAGKLRRPMLAFAVILFLGGAMSFLPLLVRLSPPGLGFLAALLGVALASLPLGMAFPVACRVRESDGSGRAAAPGRLYAMDTAGALVGLLAAVVLIPRIGISGCLVLAAIGRGLAGLLCLPLSGKPASRRDVPVTQAAPGGAPRAAVWLVAAAGFCGLGAETVWSRLLAFVLFKGSTTYAFAAMLGVVLGLASLGAWSATRGRRERALLLAARGAILYGLGLLLSLACLLLAGPQPTTAALGLSDLATTLAACGPASFLSGMIFSAACRAAAGRAAAGQGAARPAGLLLSTNALAAMAGALIVPLVLVPLAGLSASLVLLAVLALFAGWAAARSLGRRMTIFAPLALAALGACLFFAGPRWVRHLGTPVYYREGPDVSVAAIDEAGGRRLYVDGIAVAGTDLIMSSDQKTLAHLPLLLHPDPHTALTVGFGSGGTSYSMLLHPGLRVTCVEISDTVVSAAPYFVAANHGLLSGPLPDRYRLIVKDARRLLEASDERYDVIVNDCTDLAYRSDASLYTRDFFEQVGRRLRPAGIAAAWVPLRGQAPYRVLRSLIATFGSVFPNIALWVVDAYPTHFGILTGTSRPLSADMRRIRQGLETRAVRADLDEIGLADAARLASLRQFDDADLRSFSRGAVLHTDDRPVIEFLAPGESGDDASSYDFLLNVDRSCAAPALSRFAPGDLDLLGARILERPWLLAGHKAYLEGRWQKARALYLGAVRLAPGDQAPRKLLGLDRERIARIEGRDRLGAAYLLQGHPRLALETIRSVLDRDARNPRANLVRGEALMRLGRRHEAIEAFERAFEGAPSGALAGGAVRGLVRARLPRLLEIVIWALTFAGL